MKEIIDYFSSIPSSHRSAILIGGLTFFFLIESGLPVIRPKTKRWGHSGINLFFTLTTIIINFAAAFAIVKLSDLLVSKHIGLLWIVNMPAWLFMIIGLLGLDLVGAWLAHFTEHKVKWLWMFHIIHHTDTHVDVTTANRHHPGESVIRLFFTALGIAVMGAPMWLVMLYQSMSVVLSQFSHANIRIPKTLDRMISWVFISPDMHKVHHHYKLPYTNTNYGNIFSFWDRIFGTFAEVKDIKTLVYGLDTYPVHKEHSNLGQLLKHPFLPYRKPTAEDQKVEIEP